MNWRPADVVALVLAVCVLSFFVGGTTIRIFSGATGNLAQAGTLEQIAAWENMINVIIGALAGYIAGRKSREEPPGGL